MRLRARTLIKRFPLPLVRRTVVTTTPTQDNPFSNTSTEYTFLRGVADSCTVQALTGWEAKNLPEGVTNNNMFNIFTNTPLFSSIESTSNISDAIYIPDSYFAMSGYVQDGIGGWWTCEKTSIRNNGVINHCQALITKDNNLLNSDNILQFPLTTTLDPLVDTREKLFAGAWEASWIGENV